MLNERIGEKKQNSGGGARSTSGGGKRPGFIRRAANAIRGRLGRR